MTARLDTPRVVCIRDMLADILKAGDRGCNPKLDQSLHFPRSAHTLWAESGRRVRKKPAADRHYGVSVIWTRRTLPGPPDIVSTRFHSRT